MGQAAARVMAVCATAVAVMSTLCVCGLVPTTSINGMRRRRAGESDAAWRAGLRALYPWQIVASGELAVMAVMLWGRRDPQTYQLIVLGLLVALATVWGGIAALNRAIRSFQRAESER